MGDSKPKQHRARPTPFRDDRILRKLVVPNRLNHGTSKTLIASNASSIPSGYGQSYRYQNTQPNERRRPKTVTGTQTDYDDPFREAFIPSNDIFVYRVEKDTTADCIKYIMINDVEVRSTDCISKENATC